MKKLLLLTLSLAVIIPLVSAQKKQFITVRQDSARKEIIVTADDSPFTAFIYPDNLEKPTLYPIFAANGENMRYVGSHLLVNVNEAAFGDLNTGLIRSNFRAVG